jgi:hypothetical protein
MPALVAGIHVFEGTTRKTWMAGTSPAMTLRHGASHRFQKFMAHLWLVITGLVPVISLMPGHDS